jgi:hypothetical protein
VNGVLSDGFSPGMGLGQGAPLVSLPVFDLCKGLLRVITEGRGGGLTTGRKGLSRCSECVVFAVCR